MSISEDCRKDSYVEVQNSLHLNDMQKGIYSYLWINNGSSDKEIHLGTGIDKNVVTARRNELVEQGLVCEMGKKWDHETGRSVTMWGVVLKGQQSTNKPAMCLTSAEMDKMRKLFYKANDYQRKLLRGMLE